MHQKVNIGDKLICDGNTVAWIVNAIKIKQ